MPRTDQRSDVPCLLNESELSVTYRNLLSLFVAASSVLVTSTVDAHEPFVARVVNTQGTGIADAKIEVIDGEKRDKVIETLTCDPQGFVKFTAGKRVFDANVRAEGYVPRSRRPFAAISWRVRENDVVPKTIWLRRAATISGTVVGADGKPVAGAPLSVSTHAVAPYNGSVANHLKVVSEKDGSFKIKGAVEGTAILEYAAPWSGRSWVRALRVREGRDHKVRIDLSQSDCTITGSVVDADGEPVADALVQTGIVAKYNATISGQGQPPTMKLPIKTAYTAHTTFSTQVPPPRTDRRGRFLLQGLQAGRLLVRASKDRKEANMFVTLARGSTKSIRIVWPGKAVDTRTGKIATRHHNEESP